MLSSLTARVSSLIIPPVMLRAAAAILLLALGVIHAQLPGTTEYAFPTNAYQVVQRLHQKGIPVCFEQVHWQPSDAIILGEEIARLEAVSLHDRTPLQAGQLQSLNELRTRRRLLAGTQIGWRVTEFLPDKIDFNQPAGKILDALVAADPAYDWKKIRGRYVVFPREKSANPVIAGFTAQDLDFHEFYFNAIPAQVAGPANLRKLNDLKILDWAKAHPTAPLTLNLHATETRFILTAIAETLGPGFVWYIWGEHNLPFLDIYPLAPPAAKPEKRSPTLDSLLQRYEP